MYFLGLDVGTTGIKSIVYNEKWDISGYGFHECNIEHPQPGLNEQNAEGMWKLIKEVIRISTLNCKNRVGALSISIQGDAVMAIDKNWNAISPVQLGIDYRGKQESLLCEDLLGAFALFQATGMRPHPLNAFIKMLYIQKHNPQIYEQAYKLVTYSDYLLGKFGCREACIDYTMASRTMCWDPITKDWSDKILHVFDFDKSLLSHPVAPGTIVGQVSRGLAADLGLAPNCLIVAGGHDQACAPLGAGILAPGTALDSHGTAEVISTVFDKPCLNAKMFESYYPCSTYLEPGLYYSFALLHVGGILLKWFAENLCPDVVKNTETGQNATPYSVLMSSMSQFPSPLLMVPYLNGSGTPTCNLEAKGAIIGLTLNSTREEITRAIMEALAFEVKFNLQTMGECGIEIAQVNCVGGGAKSERGLQLKADIWGIPVVTMQHKESACLGAAILAAKGAGLFQNCYEAVSALVKQERCFEPDPKLHAEYLERYESYRHWCDIILNQYAK